MSVNPQTQMGTGGAVNDDWSSYYLPEAMAGLPAIPTDPNLHLDSQYYAAEGINRRGIEKQYGDYLSQLGYVDPQTGQYIPGSIVSNAQLAEDQAEQQRQQAILQNTQLMQQQGTLFSGVRAQQQALAEAPYLQQIAAQELQAPQDMAKAYQGASGLIQDYNAQNMSDLADAASRYTQSQEQQPSSSGTSGSTSGSTSGTTSTPAAPAPDQSSTDYWATPYYIRGGPAIAYAGGGEATQPTNAVVGEAGPESIVPRSGLTPEENDALTGLRQVAQMRLNGGNPPHAPIHWFGPGGSGVAYPNPGLPGIVEGLPPQPIGPVHFPPVMAHPPIQQWIAHHPGAMAGRANMPHWAALAISAMRRASGNPRGFGPGGPVIGIPPPGISPAGGGFAY